MRTRVKSLRESRGWSLVQLAERTGMTDATISRIENGKNLKTLDRLERLADAFDLPFWAIFDLPEEDQKRLALLEIVLKIDPAYAPTAARMLQGLAQDLSAPEDETTPQ
ncbi:MAG: helix-turn-helix transcriptional regulator [Pseudomonadota bacterium]